MATTAGHKINIGPLKKMLLKTQLKI
jgi:hypothetical protein